MKSKPDDQTNEQWLTEMKSKQDRRNKPKDQTNEQWLTDYNRTTERRKPKDKR